jgi:hypothetical protein
MWQACATQEEIAEAVGVDQKTIGNWEEEFVKLFQENNLTNSPDFKPPLYNVWKQQTKTNAVSHFGNSEARWVEPFVQYYLCITCRIVRLCNEFSRVSACLTASHGIVQRANG